MGRADGEACYFSIAFPKIAICTKASESLGCVEKDQEVAGNGSGRMLNVMSASFHPANPIFPVSPVSQIFC